MSQLPSILANRLLDVDGTFNFRDAGALPTTAEATLVGGRIFRSASLDGLTDNGLSTLAGLGVKTIIDLRGAQEVDEHGSFPVEQFAATHYPVKLVAFKPDFGPPAGNVDDDSATADLRRRVFAADDPMSIVFASLVDAFDEPLVETLRLLTEVANLPAVFHCTSGKDRTGYLAAVIQLLLGVERATVTADFVASAHFADIVQADMEVRYPEMMALPVEKRRQMSGMDPAWLDSAVARLGGAENLATSLADRGFDATEQEALRKTLIG